MSPRGTKDRSLLTLASQAAEMVPSWEPVHGPGLPERPPAGGRQTPVRGRAGKPPGHPPGQGATRAVLEAPTAGRLTVWSDPEGPCMNCAGSSRVARGQRTPQRPDAMVVRGRRHSAHRRGRRVSTHTRPRGARPLESTAVGGLASGCPTEDPRGVWPAGEGSSRVPVPQRVDAAPRVRTSWT